MYLLKYLLKLRCCHMLKQLVFSLLNCTCQLIFIRYMYIIHMYVKREGECGVHVDVNVFV